ncbi:hypothetical protein P153DRAFT_323456 [Dothidotthia symphoricarpi CBS 119687]|uniref:Uncharacterized protein n=1 Tax=Dothidotthia symphoricarpi CBS 119687 TaxID=1392245 RepID=A0A6A6A3X1_9PLEO|nr:uncharacterized protein P153DRAFT_323456 [Dothidotthia symphoricarpi CBS 119687]KAF2126246.1 hypothetical protein P153DRAFT_323456 [Dothidotthia symphoricarpi CBS 119687]
MDRRSLHGGPPRGLQPRLESQDARSNLAIQPATNATSFKLKKNTVKIVGAASSASNAPPRAAAPASSVTSPPVLGLAKAKPREADGPNPTKPVIKTASPAPPKIELPKQSNQSESNLESMFARLSARDPLSPSSGAPKESSPAGPNKNLFSFEHTHETTDTTSPKSPKSNAVDLSATPVKSEEPNETVSSAMQDRKVEPPKNTDEEQTKVNQRWEGVSQEDVANEYLHKASEYIDALPADNHAVIHNVQTASKKLRSAYTPDVKLDKDEVEKLKAQYVSAVVDYVNKFVDKRQSPLTTMCVKQTLQNTNGSFLHLCSTLVNINHLSLQTADDLAALCKAILSILPKSTPTTSRDEMPKSGDPVDTLKAWPSQEKRENPAAYRTCLLKGVSGVRSINELQALVWGGRLESISMPETASSYALVRFLTPEGCDKYFKATENGIEIAGDKKAVVFVEKQPGPTSINDVIQNCIDNDMTRCVRVYEADDSWSDMVLMKLARGKGVGKRDVDRIKRGKTARGRPYIEFRFANIYHALNFSRQLGSDDDWEHCSIVYAPDPCETARGIHYKDEDEDGAV